MRRIASNHSIVQFQSFKFCINYCSSLSKKKIIKNDPIRYNKKNIESMREMKGKKNKKKDRNDDGK